MHLSLRAAHTVQEIKRWCFAVLLLSDEFGDGKHNKLDSRVAVRFVRLRTLFIYPEAGHLAFSENIMYMR